MNFLERIKTAKRVPFQESAHYFKEGDFVKYLFSDERCYSERVDELLTVYRSFAGDHLVGCKVKGVHRILDALGIGSGLSVTVVSESCTVTLGMILCGAQALSKSKEPASVYDELRTKGRRQIESVKLAA